jgi:hypothetical protein
LFLRVLELYLRAPFVVAAAELARELFVRLVCSEAGVRAVLGQLRLLPADRLFARRLGRPGSRLFRLVRVCRLFLLGLYLCLCLCLRPCRLLGHGSRLLLCCGILRLLCGLLDLLYLRSGWLLWFCSCCRRECLCGRCRRSLIFCCADCLLLSSGGRRVCSRLLRGGWLRGCSSRVCLLRERSAPLFRTTPERSRPA